MSAANAANATSNPTSNATPNATPNPTPLKELALIAAGFGGQGVLFTGKIVASAALLEDRDVSWLPSYGPEMRGGTANCSVIVSEAAIGSPLVTEPNVLIALNLPSYERFESSVQPGGILFYDSSLFEPTAPRDDLTLVPLPAARLASENDLKGLGNVIMLGALWQLTHFCEEATLADALQHSISARREHLRKPNLAALALGKSAVRKKG